MQCKVFKRAASAFLVTSTLFGCSQGNNEASLSGAEPEPAQAAEIQPSESFHPFASNVVAAINMGGAAHQGVDGIQYQADVLGSQTPVGRSSDIRGSQDPTLFETYRLGGEDGKLALAISVEPGEYAITFKFAEPEDIQIGERRFDIFAEDQLVAKNLDVRLGRDNQTRSSLVKTVTDVSVADDTLNIQLAAQAGQPLLHAIVVRKQGESNDPRPWKMVWQDEFEQDGAPDATKWTHDIWPAGKVNQEDQTYTNRPENSRVENGHLVIEAHKEAFNDAEYTSARLHNKDTGDLLYGKIDVRAKLPYGQGTWAAIWMLPTDAFRYASSCEQGDDWQGSDTCDAWPNSGEIDIMEHVGYDMQTVHGTVHTKAYYWVNWQQRKASVDGKTVDSAFHTYSLEWQPDYLQISMDGVPYFYYENDGTGWQSWPFDHPFHLILNLAIGGSWGKAGGPIDDSIFPARMEIDYVRIYQLDNSAAQ